jgi:hypothetical protein
MLIWGDAGKTERVVLKHRNQLLCLEGAEGKQLLDELTALQRNVSLTGTLSRVVTQMAGIVVNTQPARKTRGSN